MAYSELIKNFGRIRDYMREFYVFGFKSRDEFTAKSARSYDNERRRTESWLGDYMRFYQTPDGKNVFLSIDSRISRHNPLYAAWKTKSFTDGDITLHFIIFDILHSPEICLTLNEITEKIDGYLLSFDFPKTFDQSTVRKKLKEYADEGIVTAEKHSKTVYYHRTDREITCNNDILDYFSEVAPCGVIGSFLLDRNTLHNGNFTFKHHYITGTLDSEIVCMIFSAMSEKRVITVESINRNRDKITEKSVVPLRVMISAQSGRQYILAYVPYSKRIKSFRTDNILSVKIGEVCENFDELRDKLNKMTPHIWGVSTQSRSGQRMEHVEFTVKYSDDETYIPRRLEREKRCGNLEIIDKNTCRFSADVFDSSELIPWIRTFICRITDFSFSNKDLENQFRNDLEQMYTIYGLEGGDVK
ncbi:MAG: WYL domain-containing protein [Clostridia bacterium]|nr:WYL domain-containing protein [Clostridia bacterium]